MITSHTTFSHYEIVLPKNLQLWKINVQIFVFLEQLLESQQIAKQHKNEIEQLKEQILVLAEEHEGKLNDDTTDNWENSLDNRAREDFAALQQECSTLKETIKTLESQLLKYVN